MAFPIVPILTPYILTKPPKCKNNRRNISQFFCCEYASLHGGVGLLANVIGATHILSNFHLSSNRNYVDHEALPQ